MLSRSLTQHRDFIWTLIRTDFKARYHGAFSGFGWALLKPLAMFVVLFSVFSFLFKNPDYLYTLLIGVVLFRFFDEATSVGVEALFHKAFLCTRAVFPRWIIIVTSTFNALLTLLVSCLAVTVVMLFSKHPPPLWALGLFACYLTSLYLIALGFSLGASVLFLEYRDLNQFWDVALRAGFFVAPVVYPIETIPERYHYYLFFWPPTPVIEFSRQALVRAQIPTLRAHLYLAAMTLTIFGAGALIFWKRLGRAMEKL
jgi:lipopolysaccharide transport system permease protein